jgi:hypothetical protein
VSNIRAKVRFEQEGSRLTAVSIVRRRSAPVIASLHRALFALGIVVSSYQVRARPMRTVERVVIQRRDGSAVDGELTQATKAAVLPIALAEPDAHEDAPRTTPR